MIAGKAVAFGEALNPAFKDYCKQIISNAQAMASAFVDRGYKLISGGTDNHLMLIDLRNKDITGKDAEIALNKADITVNKNTVPNDPQSPFVTSGIRIGTPAVTSRNFSEDDCTQLANWICDVLESPNDPSVVARVKDSVASITAARPVYASIS